jgi:hypothetical protein
VPLEGARIVTSGDRIDVAVRRDDIHLCRPGSSNVQAGWNAVDTRIRAIEYQGSFVKVMLDTIAEGGSSCTYRSVSSSRSVRIGRRSRRYVADGAFAASGLVPSRHVAGAGRDKLLKRKSR